jgi:membrane fusion protein, macrolide-specific efflux system
MRMPAQLRTRAAVVNLGFAVLLVGGGAWSFLSVRSDSATAGGATTGGSRTATVTRTTVTQTVSASGSIASSQVQGATFATSGTVTRIYVTVGETVAKGAKLAAVDPTSAQQQIRSAQDALAVAEDTLAQATDAGNTTAIDSAQTQVTTAKSDVVTEKAALTDTVLTAPIAGTVIEQNGVVGGSSDVAGATSSSSSSSAGSSLSAGSASSDSAGGSGSGSASGSATASSSGSAATGFIVLANLKTMELDVSVAEADAAKLKQGQAATVDWTALTGATATGRVASIDTTGSTSDGVVTYSVVVALTRLPAGVRIGESAAATITTGTRTGVLAVPSAAVHLDGSTHYVNVTSATGGAAHRVTVTVGLVGHTLTEVTSGLADGQTVTVPVTTTTSGTGADDGGDNGGGGPGGAGGPAADGGAAGP